MTQLLSLSHLKETQVGLQWHWGNTSAPCADGSHTHFHPVGIIGGKFLERGRIAKPKVQGGDPIVYYQAQDLYVGSRVELNRHKFVLIDTDEYALRYMEKHSDLVGNYIECNI